MIGKMLSTAIEHGLLWALGSAVAGGAAIKFALVALFQ